MLRTWPCLFLLSACGAAPPPVVTAPTCGLDAPAHALGPDVSVRCIAEDAWLFTALAPSDHAYPRYPANGLAIDRAGDAVLVDTGWTPAQAEVLLAWSAERGHPIAAAIVTHSHDDRIGGVPALEVRGVPVFALGQTAELARDHGTPFVHRPLEPDAIAGLAWLFPGSGHAPDNVVVYHPASRVLFGGCFVKALEATDLGNVADADPLGWGPGLRLVEASFPDAAIVVPGHGAPGDRALLEHTFWLTAECHADDECEVTIEPLASCACCGCEEPRALSRAEIERRRAMLLSCDPICDGVPCPSCTPPEVLGAMRAVCRDGSCALE